MHARLLVVVAALAASVAAPLNIKRMSALALKHH